jgi:hypothetical protein
MGSLFSAIKKVNVKQEEPKERGKKQDNYILPGVHVMEINRVLRHKQEGLNGKEFFIAEFKVLETDNEEMKVGSMKSFLESFKFDGMRSKNTGELQYPGLERVKQFVWAAVANDGLGPEDITEEMVENEVIGENMLAGRKVKIVAKHGKKGFGFLYLNFYPVK